MMFLWWLFFLWLWFCGVVVVVVVVVLVLLVLLVVVVVLLLVVVVVVVVVSPLCVFCLSVLSVCVSYQASPFPARPRIKRGISGFAFYRST